MPEALLDIHHLSVDYSGLDGSMRGIDDLTLQVAAGERLALVGESGCGKTSLARAIMGLLPHPGARISRGSLRLDGQELAKLNEHGYRRLRGRAFAWVPQSPTTALNPVQPIGRQMETVIKRRLGVSRRTARLEAAAALEQLELGDIDRLMRRYPHQLSGGMSQRVLIALAMACRPRLLISDEGTSALDPTTRAGTLDRLTAHCEQNGTALLLITHDFGIVAGHCQRVVVMYQGQIVEQAPIDTLFQRPRHPFTAALLSAVPRMAGAPDQRLTAIPELSAMPGDPSPGCRFAQRCPRAENLCRRQNPGLTGDHGQTFRCHFPLN